MAQTSQLSSGKTTSPLAQARNSSSTATAPDVPSGFVRLIERMMAKEPAERPPSAVAVEEELRLGERRCCLAAG